MIPDLPPYAFALFAAFMFAVGSQLQAIGLTTIDSRNGTAIGIATSAICFWLAAPWFLNPDYFLKVSIFLFIGIGLIRPALSANLGVSGIRYLGPTLSGTLSSTAPFFGVALGVLWLDEQLSWAVAFGTVGIVAAVIMLSQSGAQIAGGWPVWALALPIGAAAIRSVAHAVNKVGMEAIPDPYFATLIGFTTSALVTIFVQSTHGEFGKGLNLRGPGPVWFMIGAIMFALAVLSLNHALMIGQVVTVSPIIAATPLFTLLLSIYIFQRESITARTLIALALVTPSVIVVVLWG